MTKDNWNSVASKLDDLICEVRTAKENLAELDDIKLGNFVRDILNALYKCLSNIENMADNVYSTCEDDYYDSEDNPYKEIPAEILEVLPSNITLGQAIDLADTIKEWRAKNGLGIYD